MNRPISTPSTSTRNVEAVIRCPSYPSLFDMAQRLPGTIVELGHAGDQACPVGMLEVEQGIQVPVQVVREVHDLVPQGVGGVQLHDSARLGTSSILLLRRSCGSVNPE